VKAKRKGPAQAAECFDGIQGLMNLIDYAIVEGAELRRPLFVFLLRLARLALLEPEGLTFGGPYRAAADDAK
jgi:hypothetical protein